MLGFWQLDRAEQKRQILATQERQRQLPPLKNTDWSHDRANHLRSVDMQLRFDPDRFLLLANRLVGGQVGYEVIAIAHFVEGASSILLVNRGWVPASLDRNELPQPEPIEGIQAVRGYYYCPEPNSMIRESSEFNGAWPAIVFSLDESAVQQIFAEEERPLPCEIRLDAHSPAAFHVDWQIVNQSVAKHIGYAVQWFSMAFALIILALFSNSNLGSFFRRGNSQ